MTNVILKPKTPFIVESTTKGSRTTATKNQTNVLVKLIHKAAALNNHAAKIHYGLCFAGVYHTSHNKGDHSFSRASVADKKKVQAALIYKKSLQVLLKLLSKYKKGLPSFEDLDSIGQDTSTSSPEYEASTGATRKTRPITIQLENDLKKYDYKNHTTGVPLLLHHEKMRQTMTRMAIVVLYNIGLFYDQVLVRLSNADAMYTALLRLRRHNEAISLEAMYTTVRSKNETRQRNASSVPTMNNKNDSSSSSILLEPNAHVSMIISLEVAIFYASRYLNFDRATRLYDEGFVCSLLLPSPKTSTNHSPSFIYEQEDLIASTSHVNYSSLLVPEQWADAECSHVMGSAGLSTASGDVPDAIESTLDDSEVSRLFEKAANSLGLALDHKDNIYFQNTSRWYSFIP